jgi:hypothetical protein
MSGFYPRHHNTYNSEILKRFLSLAKTRKTYGQIFVTLRFMLLNNKLSKVYNIGQMLYKFKEKCDKNDNYNTFWQRICSV